MNATDQPPRIPREQGVDVAIAEFNALRAEIVSRISAQRALVGVGLTGVGLIFGLVIQEGGDQRLLLAVPPVVALVTLLTAGETYKVVAIGDYIGGELWEYLEKRVGALSSWEAVEAERRRRKSYIISGFVLQAPATAVFVCASVVALIVVEDADPKLLIADWTLTGVALLVPLAVGLSIRRPRDAR